MYQKLFTLLVLTFTTSFFSIAQISGNSVYENKSYNNRNDQFSSSALPVFVKDSIMYVNASILYNVPADTLVLMLGLKEEGSTVKEVNARLNKRIDQFRNSLRTLGVANNDVSTDFITQNKVYDYKISDNVAKQYLKGFEIKKTISIKLTSIEEVDKVIELAADQQIYDVIKVDYVGANTMNIRSKMLAMAADVLKQKRDSYVNLSNLKVSKNGNIISERFVTVLPNNQYNKYDASESSEIENSEDINRLRIINLRPNTTYYYNKINQSNFDAVYNNATPVVGIQYVLVIMMEYKVEK